MKKVVFSQPWGGLGDNLAFTNLIIKQLNILKKFEYDAFLVILLLTISIFKNDSILYMPWLPMLFMITKEYFVDTLNPPFISNIFNRLYNGN